MLAVTAGLKFKKSLQVGCSFDPGSPQKDRTQSKRLTSFRITKRRDVSYIWQKDLMNLPQKPRVNNRHWVNRSLEDQLIQGSDQFRRKSCCCDECGTQGKIQRRLESQHPQTLIQQIWHQEYFEMQLRRKVPKKRGKKKINNRLDISLNGSKSQIPMSEELQPKTSQFAQSVIMDSINPSQTNQIQDSVLFQRDQRKKHQTIIMNKVPIEQQNETQIASLGVKISHLSEHINNLLDRIIRKELTSHLKLLCKDDWGIIYQQYELQISQPVIVIQIPTRISTKRLSMRVSPALSRDNWIDQKVRKPTTLMRVNSQLSICESDSSKLSGYNTTRKILPSPVVELQIKTKILNYKTILERKVAISTERLVSRQTNRTVQKYVFNRPKQPEINLDVNSARDLQISPMLSNPLPKSFKFPSPLNSYRSPTAQLRSSRVSTANKNIQVHQIYRNSLTTELANLLRRKSTFQ